MEAPAWLPRRRPPRPDQTIDFLHKSGRIRDEEVGVRLKVSNDRNTTRDGGQDAKVAGRRPTIVARCQQLPQAMRFARVARVVPVMR